MTDPSSRLYTITVYHFVRRQWRKREPMREVEGGECTPGEFTRWEYANTREPKSTRAASITPKSMSMADASRSALLSM